MSGNGARLLRFIALEPGEGSEISPDSTGRFIQSIHIPVTQDDNINFLRVALEDELVERIDHPELQAAIVRWRSDVNQLDELDRTLAASWIEALSVLGSTRT